MTELERARAHLLTCQNSLRIYRCAQSPWEQCGGAWYETLVLAALTWVWEEQEKERQGRGNREITIWHRGRLRGLMRLESFE